MDIYLRLLCIHFFFPWISTNIYPLEPAIKHNLPERVVGYFLPYEVNIAYKKEYRSGEEIRHFKDNSHIEKIKYLGSGRCGSRIWSRGPPGSEAKSCQHSEAELCEWSNQFAAWVQGPLKGPGSFWVFNAQICILPHSRDSFSLIFDIYFNTKSW